MKPIRMNFARHVIVALAGVVIFTHVWPAQAETVVPHAAAAQLT